MTGNKQDYTWLEEFMGGFYEESVDAYHAFMGTYTDAESDEEAPNLLIEKAVAQIKDHIQTAIVEARIKELKWVVKTVGNEYDPMGWYPELGQRIDELAGATKSRTPKELKNTSKEDN
jgi:hypothetical protein